MALSRKDALDAVRSIVDGPRAAEAPRLERIAAAMKPCPLTSPPRVEVPTDAPTTLLNLARKAETNYMPLIVDTFGQVMKADGYYSAGSRDKASPWQHWQRNGMDARQTGVHRAALQYGVAYVTVIPGEPGPLMRGVSPRRMTALYQSPADDDWPMLALDVDGLMYTLYDEEMVYRFGLENKPRSSMDPAATLNVWGGRLTYIDERAHGVGVCPIVRYRDRMLLDGEEQFGIVEPLLTIQDRIHETTFGMLVAQFFAAFKQRYVIGWVPETEQEALKASASTLWTFEDPPDMVKVGELTETDLTKYIASKQSAIRDMAAIGQLPAQALGVDGISNISAEALAGLEAAKDRKADEITTSLGESHEQALRLAAHIAGDAEAAADYDSEIRWKDATARSFAQTVDGLGKLAQMLGVPRELLWEQIPGWTDGMVRRAKELAREVDAFAGLTDLLERQSAPVEPAV